jgi:hypothetical protein
LPDYAGHQKTTLEAFKLFRITCVTRATGGFDPCFLFQGTLASSGNGVPAHSGISLFAAERCNTDSRAYTALSTPTCSPDQPLTLYISYEQPSPKIQRPRLNVAPYRYSLRDERDDSLIACSRGFDTVIYFDTTLNMAVWGRELALSFPSYKDMEHFATCLRHVTIKKASLANHPCAPFVTSRPSTPAGVAVLTCDTPGVSLIGTALLVPRPEDAVSDADSPPPEQGKVK